MVDMVFFSKISRGVCNHQYQNSLSALQNLLMCVISISYSFLLDVCGHIFLQFILFRDNKSINKFDDSEFFKANRRSP